MPEESDFFKDILGEEGEQGAPSPRETVDFNGARLTLFDESAPYVIKTLTKVLGDHRLFDGDHAEYCPRKHTEIRDLFTSRFGLLGKRLTELVTAYSASRAVGLTQTDEVIESLTTVLRELKVAFTYFDVVDANFQLDKMAMLEMQEDFFEGEDEEDEDGDVGS